MSHHEAKFKTCDSVELHARVYPATQPGPGVVMCPGFKCVLTMLNLPNFAAALQKHGFTVVLYDPRNTGFSGGQPRDEIDPPQAVSDISDALTYLLGLPFVDSAQVGLFGISFGGTVALSASALDPRISFTIAAAPVTDLDFISSAQRARVLQKCVQDRESQVLGNEAFTIPLVNDKGENAAGFGHGYNAELYRRLLREGRRIAPGHVNRITMMTYYKVSMWTPWPLWNSIGILNVKASANKGHTIGVLFIVPEKDEVSYPEKQRHYYGEMGGGKCRKRKMEVKGASHENVLGEEYLDNIVKGILEFLKDLQDGSL
ncbi:Alpha/Beta hydrolase protein [Xylaria digitata]|nr:Alpha/Beta hydrolase protein [Xylaria digitata]